MEYLREQITRTGNLQAREEQSLAEWQVGVWGHPVPFLLLLHLPAFTCLCLPVGICCLSGRKRKSCLHPSRFYGWPQNETDLRQMNSREKDKKAILNYRCTHRVGRRDLKNQT